MCWHCCDDWGCHGWHRSPGRYYPGPSYGSRWGYYDEPSPEERRRYLEEERRSLEQRLKDVEARIAEAGK